MNISVQYFSFIAFKGTCFFCHEADHLADTFALNSFSKCSELNNRNICVMKENITSHY